MNKNICLAYIPAVDAEKYNLKDIEFKKLTHISIAFALIKNENGFPVPYLEENLIQGIRKIFSEIHSQKAGTKVLLSVGGAGADGFCDAAANGQNRKIFSSEIKKTLDLYGFDGVDIDWEFPGEDTLGIKKCRNCKKDFVLLLEEIKESIGDKLLTIAVGSNRYTGLNIKKIGEIVDYVLVMTYDLGIMQSNMFLSKIFVNMWNLHGIEKQKLCIGVPMYGRNTLSLDNSKTYFELINGKIIKILGQSFSLYNNNLWCFDTAKDILEKGHWAINKKYAGIFCWHITMDYKNELLNAMSNSVNG